MSALGNASYEIALRALSQQEQALAELRARTGTLLTAASLIGSFLGAEAIASSGLNGWAELALLAFGVSVALSIYVLLPKDGLVFTLDAPVAYETLHLRDRGREPLAGDRLPSHRNSGRLNARWPRFDKHRSRPQCARRPRLRRLRRRPPSGYPRPPGVGETGSAGARSGDASWPAASRK